MTPVETILLARQHDVRISVDGAELVVDSESPPPPELVAALRENKTQLVKMMTLTKQPEQPVCLSCRLTLDLAAAGARRWLLHPYCRVVDLPTYWAEREGIAG